MILLTLLRKDIQVAGKVLWAILAWYVLNTVVLTFTPRIYLLFTAAIALVLALALPFLDLKYPTDLFFCSLPVRRATLVHARYLSAGLGLLAGLGLGYGLGFLAAALLPGETAGLRELLTPEVFIALGLALAWIAAAFLPLYYRFGPGQALLYLGASTAVLLLGLLGIQHLDAVLRAAGAGSWILGFLKAPAPTLLRLLAQARQVLGQPFFLVVVALGAATTIWISIEVSIRFYETRDL